MNQEQKLAAIREEVIEANPEIAALRIGGKFDYGGKRYVFLRITGYDGLGQPFIEAMEENEFARLHPLRHPEHDLEVKRFTNYDFKRFVGDAVPRPIRLADVLLALYTNVISPKELREATTIFLSNLPGTAAWNLREDDLSKNPQTWDFLYDLFYPKAETQSSKET